LLIVGDRKYFIRKINVYYKNMKKKIWKQARGRENEWLESNLWDSQEQIFDGNVRWKANLLQLNFFEIAICKIFCSH
jgi:ribonuclease HI